MTQLIRPAQKKDLADLLKLSCSFPLYNLPKNKKLLKQKLEISEKSFQKKLPLFERNYVFVLEDLKLQQVIGSSQILSFSRKNRSYRYLFKKDPDRLKLVSVQQKRQQIGGLVLNQNHRGSKEKLGLQLSLSRFLYMKKNEADFYKTLEVSLTGPFQKKENPFWQETGAKHLKQDYLQALEFYRRDPSAFLKKLPKELEINLESLSEKARLCLRAVHPQTLKAYQGLLKRGFKPTGCHHLLDGAIYLESKASRLLKKIQKLELSFAKLKPEQPNSETKPAYFLIGKAGQNKFLAGKVKGEQKGRILKIEKNSLFKEGETVLSLAF